MCDQTIPYTPGTWVWAELFNRYWWPGKMIKLSSIPKELEKYRKKKRHPIAAVFFESDKSYEIIVNLNKVLLYSCAKKNEFLKKGYLLYVKQQKGGKSTCFDMKNFIKDVIYIERNIGGDIDIFKQFIEEKDIPKVNIKELFITDKKKKREKESCFSLPSFKTDKKQKLTIKGPSTPQNSQDNISKISVEHQGYRCPYCGLSIHRYSMLNWHIQNHKNSNLQVLDKSITQVKVDAQNNDSDPNNSKFIDYKVHKSFQNNSSLGTSSDNSTVSSDVNLKTWTSASEITGSDDETNYSAKYVEKEFQTSTQDVHNELSDKDNNFIDTCSQTKSNTIDINKKTENDEDNCLNIDNISAGDIENEDIELGPNIESFLRSLSDTNLLKSCPEELKPSKKMYVNFKNQLRSEPYPINAKDNDNIVFSTSDIATHIEEKSDHGDNITIYLPRIPPVLTNEELLKSEKFCKLKEMADAGCEILFTIDCPIYYKQPKQ